MGLYQKWFASQDPGAPQLDNAAGSLLSVIHACLVTGYNVKSITDITVASNVATVACTAHGYPLDNYWDMDLDVTIEGSGEAPLNGSKMITPVDANSFTYAAPGVADGVYTGTLSCRKTPLGWERLFTGADKGVYGRTAVEATPMVLRIVDDNASPNSLQVRATAGESASDVDTLVDLFPTSAQISGGLHWSKGANTTRIKNWTIIGDDLGFYLLTESSSYSDSTTYRAVRQVYWFGDINSYKAGDSYNCLISGSLTSLGGGGVGTPGIPGAAVGWNQAVTTSHANFLARSHIGVTKSVNACLVPPSGGGFQGVTAWFPSVIDNALLVLGDCYVREILAAQGDPIRGVFPGLVQPMCRYVDFTPQYFLTPFTFTDGLPGKAKVFAGMVATSATYLMAIAVDRPWRT